MLFRSSHSGQWALPGGRLDEGESPEEAALREMTEEIGLELSHDSVLGRLDDFVTRSGYVITPIVVWAGQADEAGSIEINLSDGRGFPLSPLAGNDIGRIIQKIRQYVNEMRSLTENELLMLAEQSRQYALDNFTIEKYTESFRKLIQSI